ncbi:28261_t:CDS:1, partial [Gigaspora margarita]
MSFFKKIVNKFNKRNSFINKETYIKTWKEEFKFKKFFKKLFKKDKEKEVIEKNFWGWDNTEDIESSYSTNLKADSKILTLRLAEEENPNNVIKINDWILFTNYELFRNYLVQKNIIPYNLKIYRTTKYKRLTSILSNIEFHVRVHFYNWKGGYKFSVENNTLDILELRTKEYYELLKYCFEAVNECCNEFNIIYLWSYTDLENYIEEYL